MTKPEVELINESSLLIRISDRIDRSNIHYLQSMAKLIEENLGNNLIDYIQSYTSLMICFDPLKIDPFATKQTIEKLLSSLSYAGKPYKTKTIELPVYYGLEVALDLPDLCNILDLDGKTIIDTHCCQSYDIFSLGFSPGFAFMGELDKKLQLARKASPRKKVPAGSVAIAEKQTTVYPNETPGGWHIIGRCPLKLFDTRQNPANLLQLGQKVQFKPIDKNTFLSLGGNLDE